MKQWLIKRIKKLFGNIESTLTTVFLLALFGGPIGILVFSKNALNYFLQTVNIPTPLWATIALVLLCFVYIYLKQRQLHSSEPSPLNCKIEYFTIGNLKWKTKVYDYGYFEVDKYPICLKHDLPFIFSINYKYCPEVDKNNCNNKIYENDEFKIYETAKSYIDKEIRKQKKC